MSTKTLEELYPYASMTKDFEGYSDQVYPGAVKGEPTVGYGFNLNSPLFKGMSVDQILANKEELFIKAYASARFDASKFVGYDTFIKLSPERQHVLTDMAYNMGPNKLAEFKRFNEALQNQDFNKAANEMVDSNWYKQVGRRSKKLVQIMKGK